MYCTQRAFKKKERKINIKKEKINWSEWER
jgi:hypothetical protein